MLAALILSMDLFSRYHLSVGCVALFVGILRMKSPDRLEVERSGPAPPFGVTVRAG
jgi:hypothetical protein